MKKYSIVPMPEKWNRCRNPDHWQNVLILGDCTCRIREEAMRHEGREMPSDEEIDGMYAQEEQEAYRNAH